MFVEFWDVGAATSALLPMSVGDISRQLAVDWVPSLPPADGTAFIGWPPFLIEDLPSHSNTTLLALRDRAARSERQWKGVVSWMLGVAGARQFLRQEGYTWVAPLSAFYPDAACTVDVQAWPPQFPKTRLVADRSRASRSRLRPDYIAARPMPSAQSVGAYEWAVAEAKGVADQLSGKTACPADWYNQARNVAVTVNGEEIMVPRHLVVATRVNPNAVKASTRRLQIRAWNRNEEPGQERRLPPAAAVDIASAHLFGMFRALRLRESALALALSVQRRAEIRRRQDSGMLLPEGHREEETETLLQAARPRAHAELAARTQETAELGGMRVAVASIETVRGTVVVEIAEPLVALAQRLQEGPAEEEAALAVHKADAELARLERERRAAPDQHGGRQGPIGIEVRLPEGFSRP
jgi:hypothetical protein